MRALIVLAMILSTSQAFAETSQLRVACKGETDDRAQIVETRTNEKADALELVIYSAQGKGEDHQFIPYRIVSSQLMFPVSSIQAREDFRPVDGSLVELDLQISTMEVRGPGETYPATLEVKSTFFNRFTGKEETELRQHSLDCRML